MAHDDAKRQALRAAYVHDRLPLEEAARKAAALQGKVIRLSARCGEKGRLYGSITAQEIADALKAQHGVDVDKRKIECEPIRQTGEYEATVWVYSGITAKMKVFVTPAGK